MTGNEKIIAIGDIHGCCRSVAALMKKLESLDNYQLLFIGDYIDRGPCSKEVISLMTELGKERNCVFLRGNHEQMLLDAVDTGVVTRWLYNGGGTTLKSYETDPGELNFPDDHMEFYRKTRLYYETAEYLFVHAGITPNQTVARNLERSSADTFLWTRDHMNVFETPWEKTVVFGHTPQREPVRRKNMIGIDTGCVFASSGFGTLTALILPDETFIQQHSLDNDEINKV
ncbi:MAG: metallophosphoesterase family protein [Balneolaceae bacterium]